jgi:hypothetical protein
VPNGAVLVKAAFSPVSGQAGLGCLAVLGVDIDVGCLLILVIRQDDDEVVALPVGGGRLPALALVEPLLPFLDPFFRRELDAHADAPFL